MTKNIDDFEAVRIVVGTLEPFDSKDRERIIRWAKEKLGMPQNTVVIKEDHPESQVTPILDQNIAKEETPPITRRNIDIKSFVSEKSPSSDRQLAAVIAYYYAFEAPENEQKESIGSDDVTDACRKAGVRRPTNSGQTLRNAAHAGYLDRAEKGRYRLNSVGENLVAMVLPDGSGISTQNNVKKKKRKVAIKKKSAKKKTAKKKS